MAEDLTLNVIGDMPFKGAFSCLGFKKNSKARMIRATNPIAPSIRKAVSMFARPRPLASFAKQSDTGLAFQ